MFQSGRRAASEEQTVGFWNWLMGKPKSVEVIDRIWMNQEAKVQGLCKEVQDQPPATPLLLAVFHFPATLGWLRLEFTRCNLAHKVQERPLSPADCLRAVSGGNPTILLAHADALVPDEYT